MSIRMRGLSMMVAGSLFLMIAGCAEDNEAAFKNKAEANGAAAAAPAGSLPKDQTEYFKKQQEAQAGAFGKDSGYPTTKTDSAAKPAEAAKPEAPK